MRRETHSHALSNAIALRSGTNWLQWLCFNHQWIEEQRFDDLVCERCTRCDRQRQWNLPVDLHNP
jgi:hypothetical protein